MYFNMKSTTSTYGWYTDTYIYTSIKNYFLNVYPFYPFWKVLYDTLSSTTEQILLQFIILKNVFFYFNLHYDVNFCLFPYLCWHQFYCEPSNERKIRKPFNTHNSRIPVIVCLSLIGDTVITEPNIRTTKY